MALYFCNSYYMEVWPVQVNRYSNSLLAGQSGYRIPVRAIFCAPVQTGLGARPASCKMDNGSFPAVKGPVAVVFLWKGPCFLVAFG
jgi:hypothetical protein